MAIPLQAGCGRDMPAPVRAGNVMLAVEFWIGFPVVAADPDPVLACPGGSNARCLGFGVIPGWECCNPVIISRSSTQADGNLVK
jgi:hypothetical protein